MLLLHSWSSTLNNSPLHNSLSPHHVSSFLTERSVHSVHSDCTPVVCMHVSAYAWVCTNIYVCAAWGSVCKRVGHATTVNLNRKLKLEHQWQFNFLSWNGLCSLFLGKSCHVHHRGGLTQLHDGVQRLRIKRKSRGKKGYGNPISQLLPPTLPPVPSSYWLWVHAKGRESVKRAQIKGNIQISDKH